MASRANGSTMFWSIQATGYGSRHCRGSPALTEDVGRRGPRKTAWPAITLIALHSTMTAVSGPVARPVFRTSQEGRTPGRSEVTCVWRSNSVALGGRKT